MLGGHTSGITDVIEFSKNKIITVSKDKTIRKQTRGIDRVRAEELMVRASLAGIADKIPSDDIRCGVNTYIADVFKVEGDEEA